VQIELLGLKLQHVTGRLRHEDLLGGPLAAGKQLPQPRNVAVQRRRRGLRRLFAPELLDQPVAGDHLVRAQQEERKEGAALLTPELDHSAAIEHLKWAEQPELHAMGLLCTQANTPR
jgi:hypothetical protein